MILRDPLRVAVWTEWGDGRLVSAESTAESAVGDAEGITAGKKYSVSWPWRRKQRGGTRLVLSMDFDVVSDKSKGDAMPTCFSHFLFAFLYSLHEVSWMLSHTIVFWQNWVQFWFKL